MQVGNQNNLKTEQSLSNFLYSTTLGSMGTTQCQMLKFSQTLSKQSQINIQCSNGTINYNYYEYGIVNKIDREEQCQLVDELKLYKQCNNETQMISDIQYYCQNKTQCTFQLNKNHFQNSSECQFINNSVLPIYFKIFCNDVEVQLPNGQKFSKTKIAISFAFLDAAIIIFYIFLIISLKISSKKALSSYLEHSLSPSLFTLEFSNINENLSKEECISGLWKEVEMRLNKYYNSKKHSQNFQIVDVQVAQSSRIIGLFDERGTLLKAVFKISFFKQNLYFIQKSKLMREWAKKFDPYHENKDKRLPELSKVQDLMLLLSEIKNKKIYNKATNQLKKLQKMEEKVQKINKSILAIEQDESETFQFAWITFETMKQRDLASHFFFTSPFERLLMCIFPCFCKKRRLNFEGKNLIVNAAPDPSNINWGNLSISSSNRMVRRLFSIAITIILLTITFLSVASLKIKQDNIQNKFPPVQCTDKYFQNIDQEDVINEYNSGIKQGYSECYCKQNLVQKINQNFQTIDGPMKICLDYSIMVSYRVFLPFLIVCVVVSINWTMQALFRFLSRIEKHIYLSTEYASRVLKIFLASFLNTGIIILIINFKLKGHGFKTPSYFSEISQGKYSDLTPAVILNRKLYSNTYITQWFQKVGTVIILTMIINIFSTPIQVLSFHLFRLIRRLKDQRFKCNKKITKMAKQSDYENLYMGPEFLIDVRYAQVLNIIFVCFLYSSGIPILYFTCLFQLILTYYLDKYFVLKICRIPKKIDEKLEDIVKHTMIFIVGIHLLVAIWILGNNTYFNMDQSLENSDISIYTQAIKNQAANFFNKYSVEGNYFNEMKKRVTKSQNIILFVLLLLLVFLFLLYAFAYKPLQKCIKFCFKKYTKIKFISGKNSSSFKTYYQILNRQQLKQEKQILSIDLNRNASNKERNEELRNFQIRQYNILKQQINITKKKQQEGFIGHFSYDIRHDPIYKELFGVEEDIKEQENK